MKPTPITISDVQDAFNDTSKMLSMQQNHAVAMAKIVRITNELVTQTVVMKEFQKPTAEAIAFYLHVMAAVSLSAMVDFQVSIGSGPPTKEQLQVFADIARKVLGSMPKVDIDHDTALVDFATGSVTNVKAGDLADEIAMMDKRNSTEH